MINLITINHDETVKVLDVETGEIYFDGEYNQNAMQNDYIYFTVNQAIEIIHNHDLLIKGDES